MKWKRSWIVSFPTDSLRDCIPVYTVATWVVIGNPRLLPGINVELCRLCIMHFLQEQCPLHTVRHLACESPWMLSDRAGSLWTAMAMQVWAPSQSLKFPGVCLTESSSSSHRDSQVPNDGTVPILPPPGRVEAASLSGLLKWREMVLCCGCDCSPLLLPHT